MEISVTLEGEQQVHRKLLIVANGITDFSNPLRNIGGELQKTFQLNFAQEGALFGGWADRKKDYPWPILNKTGRMRQGFRQNVGMETLTITNVVPYFKYHQSNKERTRLPRRVMMMIDNDRRNFIVKEFQAYIVGLLRSK